MLSHTGIGGKLLLFKDTKAEHPSNTLDFADVVRVTSGASAKSVGGMFSSKSSTFRYEIKIEGTVPSSFPSLAADSSSAREQWIENLEKIVPRFSSRKAVQLMASNAQYERSAAELAIELNRIQHEALDKDRQWKAQLENFQRAFEESERKRERAEGELQILRRQRDNAAQTPLQTTVVTRSAEVPSAQLEAIQRSMQNLVSEVTRLKAATSDSLAKNNRSPDPSLGKALAADINASLEVTLDNVVDSIVNQTADLLRANSSKSTPSAEVVSQVHQLKQAVEQGSDTVMAALQDVRKQLEKKQAEDLKAGTTSAFDTEALLAQMKPRLRSLFSDFEATISNKVAESSKKVTDGLTAMAASNKQFRSEAALESKNLATQIKETNRESFEGLNGKLALLMSAVESLRQRPPAETKSESISQGFAQEVVAAVEERIRGQMEPLTGMHNELRDVVDVRGRAMLEEMKDVVAKIDDLHESLQNNVRENMQGIVKSSDLEDIARTTDLEDLARASDLLGLARASDVSALESNLMNALAGNMADNTDRISQELSRLADSIVSASNFAQNAPVARSVARSPSPTASLYGERDTLRLEKLREVVEDAIGEALAEERKRTTSLERSNLALINDKLTTMKTFFEEQIRLSTASVGRTSEPSSPARSLPGDRLAATETRSQLHDIESKVTRLEKESHHLHDIQEGWLKQLNDSMRHIRKDVSELAISERERDRYLREATGGAYGNKPGVGPPEGVAYGPNLAEMIRESHLALAEEIRSLREQREPLSIGQMPSTKSTEDACVGTDTEGLVEMVKEVKQLEDHAQFLSQHVQDLEETRENLEREKDRLMMELSAIIEAKKAAWTSLRQMESSEVTIQSQTNEGSLSTLAEPARLPPSGGSTVSTGEGFGSRLRELFELRGAIRQELSSASLRPLPDLGKLSPGATSPVLNGDSSRMSPGESMEEISGVDQGKKKEGKAKRVISGLWQKAFNHASQ